MTSEGRNRAGHHGAEMCRRLLLSALAFLCLAGCGNGERQAAVAARIGQIDAARLRAHVESLTSGGPRSPHNLPALRHAERYIESRLASWGYRPRTEIVRTDAADGAPFVNVVAEHRGSREPTRFVELGAHYDSVDDSPGADDNASGVAAVLEIARVLATAETPLGVRFCLFTLEEDGRDGSRAHVRSIRERKDRLEGALVFEMIGYATDAADSQATPARIPLLFSPPRTGNFVAVVGNLRSGGLGNRFERAAELYVPELPLFSANRIGAWFRDALRSDHKPYWDAGYRAIMLTDTADFRNPNYHQPSDVADTLDYGFLQGIARATAAVLLQ
ncbi:MAG TPA: M20/M25/M40 family metallo-hydrolase [Gammaproteobacteria bacterium]|nr:M20/M25/M40 family metallo-hydrolase [Gammaproteobacteria bacterium]